MCYEHENKLSEVWLLPGVGIAAEEDRYRLWHPSGASTARVAAATTDTKTGTRTHCVLEHVHAEPVVAVADDLLSGTEQLP